MYMVTDEPVKTDRHFFKEMVAESGLTRIPDLYSIYPSLMVIQNHVYKSQNHVLASKGTCVLQVHNAC